MKKINLTEGDYSILVPLSATSGYNETSNELKNAGSTYYNTNINPTITTKVTAAGALTVTAE